MAATLYANDELVTCAWLGLVFDDTSMVGTTLPEDPATWAANGFVQAGPALGSGAGPDVPLFMTVIQVDTWACTLTSQKSPWGQANNLAMTIVMATYSKFIEKKLVLPGSYPDAYLKTVQMNMLPRRMPGDPAGYARYTMELKVNWTPVLV